MRARFRYAAALLSYSTCSIALFGCGETPPVVPPDAGMEPDSGSDAGPPLTCATTRRLDAVMDDTVSVSFDTSMSETRPRDLGVGCGNDEAELRWAPQEVVELHVPGSGPVAVAFDSVLEGTDEEFNTVIQVRRTCETVPAGIFPPSCFDDTDRTEFRSRGAVQAMGGDVLFFVVTGYSEPPAMGGVDRGTVQIDFEVSANVPPTLATGYFRLANDDVYVGATGTDPDANAAGIAMNFLGPDGALLDIYGDGEATMEGDVFTVSFDPAPTAAAYDAGAVVLASQVNLGGYLRAVNASAVILRVFDRAFAVSGMLEVTIDEATLVGFGEPCDAENVCRQPMSCNRTTNLCEVVGPARTVCESGTVVPIATPTDAPTTAMVSGTTGAGLGQYWPTTMCVADAQGGQGAEKIYILGVGVGEVDRTFDLQATTALPGTGSTDTIVYLRRTCPDSGTEVACNDDVMMGTTTSLVNARDLTPGVYYVFVETYGGLGSGTAPHQIQFTLKSVRVTGETCDPTGVMNRCATGSTCAGDPAVCS